MKDPKGLYPVLIAICVVLAGIVPTPFLAFAASPPRPNIVFILTDDLDTEAMNHLPRGICQRE